MKLKNLRRYNMSKLKMMDIPFKDNETEMIEMQDFINEIGQEALYMNHYEL